MARPQKIHYQPSRRRISPLRVTLLAGSVTTVLALMITLAIWLPGSGGHKTAPSMAATLASSEALSSPAPSEPASLAPSSAAAPSSWLSSGASAGSSSSDTASAAPAVSIQNPDVAAANIKIAMVGDILLHTKPIAAAKTKDGSYRFDNYFNEVHPLFEQHDLNLFNMEGPIDANGDNKPKSYPTFNYPSQLAAAMKGAGFHVAITANNHAFDQGWKGLLSTRKHLLEAGLDVTGTYENDEQLNTPLIRDVKGVKVGICAYSSLDNGMSGGSVAPHKAYAMPRFSHDSTDSVPAMLARVAALREAGAEVVIMSLHWGSEYVDKPTAMQKTIARLLVEGGVDILLGGHSHCLQPIEVLRVPRGSQTRDAVIIYSTGNFMADQLALEKPMAKTQEGMIVSVGINKTATGCAIVAANYTPTLCYRDAIWAENGYSVGYRILPVGQYATLTDKPSGLSATVWQKCKDAWKRVPKTVGDAIPHR